METSRKTNKIVDNQPSIAVGTRIGQFEVVRFIDRGGMGEVYLARDTKLGRKVALKLIRARSPERLRFFKEAQSTARFNHPNIVTLYFFGEYNGLPYQVLEFLNGQTLRRRMRDNLFGLQERLRVTQDIASAMVEAHRHRVFHLDLKPANVMIDRSS